MDQRTLLGQQGDGGVELLAVELEWIRDAKARLRPAEVQRRVRDLHRVVGYRDVVVVGRVVDSAPARRLRRDILCFVQQDLSAPLQRYAVVNAADSVVRRAL